MFFSCQKVQENKEEALPETKEQTVSFNALPMGETKTAFTDPSDGKYPTLWTTNDEKVKISMNYEAPKDATVTPSKDYTKATFAASFEAGEATEFTFYALSPASAYVSVNKSYSSLNIAIPTTQTPISKSVDEAAQVIFAKSATLGAFPTESVDLHFSHLTAYACMTLKNLELGEATISSISITAGSDIAGRWYYYPGDGTYTASSGSATITVNTSSAANVMFALAPVDLAGKTLKIVVNTDQGTFTKNIASWPSGKVFRAGHVAKFALDMTGIVVESPKVYNLVKDVAELTAGSKVIIAGATSSFAISTTQNGNNRADASVTISDEKISSPSESVEIFTIEAGTKANTYAFQTTNSDAVDTNDGYIYAASASANHLKTEASKSDNSSFAISIDATGIATVVAQGTNTRNHMRHNESSSCFSCYASSSTVTEKVSIYKLAGSGAPVVVTPVINVTSDNPMAVSNANDLHAIEYTISNPTSAVISAVANVSWIHDFDCSTAGEVSFEVDANQVKDAPARNGVITLSYEGAVDVEVTVNQAKGPVSGVEETITEGTFTGTTASISMTTTSGITVSQLKDDGSNVNTTYNTVSTLRVYRANQMSFTGKTFTRIEMYYTGSYSGVDWTVSAGGGTVSIDTSNKKVVWENAGGAATVTLKNSTTDGTNTQFRSTQFVVTYKAD